MQQLQVVAADSDEELDDDLPSISVVANVSRESSWSMPSAGKLAEQRQREQRNEDELLALRRAAREQGGGATAGQLQGGAGAGAGRSDSSGSEGEAALAAAVGALQVLEHSSAAHSTPPPAHTHTATALALLTALNTAGQLTPLEQLYLDALRGARTQLQCITSQIVCAVGNAPDPCTWDSVERVSVARVLCAGALGGRGGGTGRAVRRALQRVLDGCEDWELRTLVGGEGGVALADAAAGGGAGGAQLAALIAAAGLTALARVPPALPLEPLTPPTVPALLTHCKRLSPRRQLQAAALAGRALSQCGRRAPRPRWPAATRLTPLTPDHHRLAVALTRLQLLFISDAPLDTNS